MLKSLDALHTSGIGDGMVKITCQGTVQNRVDKRGFSATRNACYGGYNTERNIHVYIFKVIFAGTDDAEVVSVTCAASFRHFNHLSARKVVGGNRISALADLIGSTDGNDLATVDTCARTNVNDIICLTHGFLVVLNHDNAVAKVTELFQSADKLVVITLVKTDRGLVKDIKHACQRRADLSGKANSLCLTARKRACSTGEVEVIETNRDEEVKASLNFLEDFLCNLGFALAEAEILNEIQHFINRKTANFVNIQTTNSNAKHHGRKARAVTFWTGNLLHEFLIIVTALHLHALLNNVHDAVKCGVLFPAHAAKVADYGIALIACAVHEGIHSLLREIRERCGEVKAVFPADLGKERTCPGVLCHGLKAVDGNTAVTE